MARDARSARSGSSSSPWRSSSAAFLGGSGYAEYRAGRTHALTTEIADNESPSIMHLAAARAELRDLQRLLNTHVLQASTGQPTSDRSR